MKRNASKPPKPDPGPAADASSRRQAEQSKAALDNVREGYDGAAPVVPSARKQVVKKPSR